MEKKSQLKESASTNKKRLPVIGLTGGIGTGKSTAAFYFKELGAKIIDADKVGKYLVDTDETVKQEIKSSFGEEYFDNGGNLKRKELGEVVFSDINTLQKLNNILHPLMIRNIEQQVNSLIYLDDYKMIIVDAAIIFETKQEKKFDFIVTVSSIIDKCRERIITRDGITIENFNNRVKSQLDLKIKEQNSDYIIYNNGTQDELKKEVQRVFDSVLQEFYQYEI
ncbi:dephospho-CoA kinase [candidate division KSB1 bacterium]